MSCQLIAVGRALIVSVDVLSKKTLLYLCKKSGVKKRRGLFLIRGIFSGENGICPHYMYACIYMHAIL